MTAMFWFPCRENVLICLLTLSSVVFLLHCLTMLVSEQWTQMIEETSAYCFGLAQTGGAEINRKKNLFSFCLLGQSNSGWLNMLIYSTPSYTQTRLPHLCTCIWKELSVLQPWHLKAFDHKDEGEVCLVCFSVKVHLQSQNMWGARQTHISCVNVRFLPW